MSHKHKHHTKKKYCKQFEYIKTGKAKICGSLRVCGPAIFNGSFTGTTISLTGAFVGTTVETSGAITAGGPLTSTDLTLTEQPSLFVFGSSATQSAISSSVSVVIPPNLWQSQTTGSIVTTSNTSLISVTETGTYHVDMTFTFTAIAGTVTNNVILYIQRQTPQLVGPPIVDPTQYGIISIPPILPAVAIPGTLSSKIDLLAGDVISLVTINNSDVSITFATPTTTYAHIVKLF